MPGNITVRLFHRLRELVGQKSVSISPAPESIAGLISRFLELYPDAKDELLEENGEFSRRYVVAVNEKMMKRSEWDDARLQDGDEAAFLTMLSGG